MKRLGLVGGLGPESTIDYYRKIIQSWVEIQPDTLPAVLIDSLDVNRGIELVRNDHDGLVEYLLESLHRLKRAGCDLAAMAANTPHLVFDALADRSPLPLVSIVEAAAENARAEGYGRVGLLGTGFTMGSTFYQKTYSRIGIEVVVPPAEDRDWLQERYLGELLKGVFRDETREGVQRLIADLEREQGVDAVLLAGTELPLLVSSESVAGVPLVDTGAVHIAAILRQLTAVAP
ncbi:MAG: amino acid racemase [Acidobacteriota bacterium]|nr:amino acid racemase [Acidobacteriota bacterium]